MEKMKPSDILAKYYQEHGLPPLMVEEVPLPEGMNFVVRSQRIIGVTHEAKEVAYIQTEEVPIDGQDSLP